MLEFWIRKQISTPQISAASEKSKVTLTFISLICCTGWNIKNREIRICIKCISIPSWLIDRGGNSVLKRDLWLSWAMPHQDPILMESEGRTEKGLWITNTTRIAMYVHCTSWSNGCLGPDLVLDKRWQNQFYGRISRQKKRSTIEFHSKDEKAS